jgi:endonuclease-3 related protein
MKDKGKRIRKIYNLLHGHFGDLGWWPAESPFEVMVGAVLTQNTSWSNVEKAIERLKDKGLMRPSRMAGADAGSLSRAIRPAGYFRVKARRLKEMSRFIIKECGGKLDRLGREDILCLREKLLGVKGVGPETADSILVYALGKPVFVVDAYTRRVFSRHGLTGESASYEDVQRLVHENIPLKVKTMNQFHALLVEAGKRYCRKKSPKCGECPLRGMKRRHSLIT